MERNITNIKPGERILRLNEVKARTGLSRSTIYLAVGNGTFPRHINLGIRCVGWLESEIDSWIAARIADSRSSTASSNAKQQEARHV